MAKSTTQTAKPIAFYLPQFHCIPENDEWWGKGFTEWTNVRKAKPNFPEQHQPQIPLQGQYYDLSDVEVMRQQTELAKAYGVFGFCYYWYWFNGRQVLEKPIFNFLKSDIDFPFCLCWANENWTRTWDGDSKKVLLKQDYESAGLSGDFFAKALPFFQDPRYIRIDGKPLLLVYRVDQIPQIKELIQEWKSQAQASGLPDLLVAAVYSFEINDYTKYGCDLGIEFPPHQFFNHSGLIKNDKMNLSNPEFTGCVYDYAHVVNNSLSLPASRYADQKVIPGFMPSWDNTARRQNTSNIFAYSSPAFFNYWLAKKLGQLKAQHCEPQYLFINAWNEWGEGCHLEPDERYQKAYLEALQKGLSGECQEMAQYDQKIAELRTAVRFKQIPVRAFQLVKKLCLGNKTLAHGLRKMGHFFYDRLY